MTKGDRIDELLAQALEARSDDAMRAILVQVREAAIEYAKTPATVGDVASMVAAAEQRVNSRLSRIELNIRALQQAVGRTTGQMLRAVSKPMTSEEFDLVIMESAGYPTGK